MDQVTAIAGNGESWDGVKQRGNVEGLPGSDGGSRCTRARTGCGRARLTHSTRWPLEAVLLHGSLGVLWALPN